MLTCQRSVKVGPDVGLFGTLSVRHSDPSFCRTHRRSLGSTTITPPCAQRTPAALQSHSHLVSLSRDETWHPASTSAGWRHLAEVIVEFLQTPGHRRCASLCASLCRRSCSHGFPVASTSSRTLDITLALSIFCRRYSQCSPLHFRRRCSSALCFPLSVILSPSLLRATPGMWKDSGFNGHVD